MFNYGWHATSGIKRRSSIKPLGPRGPQLPCPEGRLTAKQAAEFLGVTKEYLKQRRLKNKTHPAYIKRGQSICYSQEGLVEFKAAKERFEAAKELFEAAKELFEGVNVAPATASAKR